MAKGMSEREYAAYRKGRGLPGGSRTAVTKALKADRIRKGPDGKIDPEEADRMWGANTSEAKRRDTPSTDTPSPSTYQEARAVREVLNARITRLEYEERLGELVSASEVTREAYRTGRVLRDRLKAIPGRVAAQLAAETSSKRIALHLDAEIRQVLDDVLEEE